MDVMSIIISFYICIVLMFEVDADGQLYIGLLNFANPSNLKDDGTCCDIQNNSRGQCSDFCDLVFNVSVHGLNTGQPIAKQPSKKPIFNTSSTSFPSQNKSMINPLAFDFERWPGSINIVVDVYDYDQNRNGETVYECVDHFVFVYKPTGPSGQYCQMIDNGTRIIKPTSLKILLRYQCNQLNYDKDCLNDCLHNPNQEKCHKTTVDTAQPVTDWDILISTPKPMSNGMCGNILMPQNGQTTVQSECKNETSTEVLPDNTPTSTSTMPANTNKAPISSAHVSVTTQTSFTNNQGKLFAFENTTKTHTEPENSQTSEKIQVSSNLKLDKTTTELKLTGLTTTTRIPHKQEIRTIIDETEKSVNSNTNGNPERRSSTEQPYNKTQATAIPDNNSSGAMEYWPAIVGGVLGALALLAAISFVVYYKKQKDAQIRQDIYNVNPKKWALEPPEENGTSGKSEIALETEPV